MFSPVSGDELQRPAQQALGIAQALFCLANRRPEILATRRNRQRANFCELLPISLYVFGDDRQSCGDGIVHRSSLARRMTNRDFLVCDALGIVTTCAFGDGT